MMKTYDVTCPYSWCGEIFEVEIDPETEDEMIECPECRQQCDWEYYAATDALDLIPDEDIEEDGGGDDDEEEDELGLG